MSDYPEHDKLTQVTDDSQIIGEFLEWLTHEQGIELCRLDTTREFDNLWVPAATPHERLLATYFGIDLGKIETEKRQMLADLAQMQ